MFLCSRRSMVLATSALILAMTVPARADDVCTDLRSRLANFANVGIPLGDVASYSNAITEQSNQLQSARASLRQLGCSTGSVKVYRTLTARQCSELAASVERMERSLSNLEARRNTLASMESGEEARARILSEIEAKGCDGVDESGPVTASQVIEAPLPDDASPLDGLETRQGTGGSGGRLRTVCVRTCDGGFFPVTSGASPLDFRRDQRVCAKLCPQTETELYYQALDSVDAGEMVSTVTGRLYKQLPAAFAYRTGGLSKPQACGCGRIAYKSLTTGTGTVKESTGSVTTIRMHPVASDASQKTVIERPYDPEKDKVRNVGPVFVPDEPKIDLRNPAN